MENESYEQMVIRHKDRVHSYAVMMLRDPAEAQDVAQEALIRLWQHREQVELPAVSAWLSRTVHNLCIDRIRKRNVRAEVVNGGSEMEHEIDVSPGPQQLLQSKQLGQQILGSLQRLSAEDRAVVLMREVQSMPYDQIAHALGVPLGTLKARLHRARDRLRAGLSRVGAMP